MIDIVDKGKKLFSLVSVLPACKLDSFYNEYLNNWLCSGRAANLEYMKRPFDRTDPSIILKDVKTIVVVGRSYSKIQREPGIARFAQGEDYHKTIKEDLYRLLTSLQEDDINLKGRAVVDTAPIFEKAWAVKAGFGWVGKNSLVINPILGSYFNIGLLLLNKQFPSVIYNLNDPMCGQCRLCIDSCPMHAIGEDLMIDARKCISNLTVEKVRKGESVSPIHGWSYGCDECQICCPFNR